MGKPTIVVVNGTAGEGYWSAFYLLKTGEFNVRATARRPDSEKARKLRTLGCEVVAASTEDADALGRAFEGARASTARPSTTSTRRSTFTRTPRRWPKAPR